MLFFPLFFSITIINLVISTTFGRTIVHKDPLTTKENHDTSAILHRQRGRRWSHRIIGGGPVQKGEYPWFVNDIDRYCGGSLISSKHVLTAAHCQPAFVSSVIVGALCIEQNNCNQTYEVLNIKSRHIHPGYEDLAFDFMIVELRTESTIDPIPIDYNNASMSYTSEKDLWVAGTGYTMDDEPLSQPDRLMEAKVKYVPQTECKSVYDSYLDETMLCAADIGKDACQGDSGGPLIDKENRILVGVSSWGVGCGDVKYPGVYARISDQLSWIVDTVCKDYKKKDSDSHDKNSNIPHYCRGPSKSPSNSPIKFEPSSIPSLFPSLTPSLIQSASPSVDSSLLPYFEPMTNDISDTKPSSKSVLPGSEDVSSIGLTQKCSIFRFTLLSIIGLLIFC